MSAQDKQPQPVPVIKIICDLLGTPTNFEIKHSVNFRELVDAIYEIYHEDHPEVSLTNFEKACVCVVGRFKFDPDTHSSKKSIFFYLADGGRNVQTVNVSITKKSWTTGINFDEQTLSAVCPYSKMVCEKPLKMDDCCKRIVDRDSMLGNGLSCPMCDMQQY